MAIVSTTIKIYTDQQCTNLVGTQTVAGNVNQATITGLSAGSEYYATAQSTDDLSQTGNISSPYRFYTVPNVAFDGNFTITSDSFSIDIITSTDVVDVKSVGIVYDTNSSFTNKQYVEGNTVSGLIENETYYCYPYVIDQFDRMYENNSVVSTVSTVHSLPTVDWVSIIDITDTNFNAVINVQSSTALTSVEAKYYKTGEESQSQMLDPVVGEQTINISGLEAESEYTISIRATNDYGVGDSVPFTFNTLNTI